MVLSDPNALALLRAQFQKPSDILSVLMILGSTIISKAHAQSISTLPLSPAPFSFGHVSHAFETLSSAAGSGRMLPPPDWPALVINAKSGYTRTNASWVLGRILRDFETSEPNSGALKVVRYSVGDGAGDRVERDMVFWSGLATIVVQLGVAAVPWGQHGNWTVLAITVLGTALAVIGTSLPSLRHEKWTGRARGARTTPKTVVLTRGNGSRHAMLLQRRAGLWLDLEDLATEQPPVGHPAIAHGALMVGWLVLLFCICGLQEDTWYILAVGLAGMGWNVLAATVRRRPGGMGVPLKREKHWEGRKVMQVLMALELEEEGAGRSLVGVFFPGKLWDSEKRWWAEVKSEEGRKKWGEVLKMKGVIELKKDPPPQAISVIVEEESGDHLDVGGIQARKTEPDLKAKPRMVHGCLSERKFSGSNDLV